MIDNERTSTGRYPVSLLHLEGHFDPDFRIRIRIANEVGRQSVLTGWPTPDRLDLAHPVLTVPPGNVDITVSVVDGMGVESTRTTLSVAVYRDRGRNGAELVGMLMLVGGGFGLLLILVVLLIMWATERTRTRSRGETEPTGLVQQAADEHIRSVALQALLALVVVAAIVVASLGMDAAFVPIFSGPILLIVALHAILRVVNAGRAIALLHQPAAQAFTRYDQLEVAAPGRRVTLRSSPTLVARARRHALPKATL